MVLAAGNESFTDNLLFSLNTFGSLLRPIYKSAWRNAGLVIGSSSSDVIYSGHITGDAVNLYAPGVGVTYMDQNGDVRLGEGTSFAAPIVSGSLALLKSLFNSKSMSEIKAALIDCSDDGLLNVNAAYDCLGNSNNSGFWNYSAGDGCSNYFMVSYDDASGQSNTTLTEQSTGLDVKVKRPTQSCDTVSLTAKEALPDQPWEAVYDLDKLGRGSSNFYIWHDKDNYIRFYLSTDDVPYLRIRSTRNGTGSTNTIESSSSYLNNNNEFKITWDENQYRFYLNGIEKGAPINGDFFGSLDTTIRLNTLTCLWKSGDAHDIVHSVGVSDAQ